MTECYKSKQNNFKKWIWYSIQKDHKINYYVTEYCEVLFLWLYNYRIRPLGLEEEPSSLHLRENIVCFCVVLLEF